MTSGGLAAVRSELDRAPRGARPVLERFIDEAHEASSAIVEPDATKRAPSFAAGSITLGRVTVEGFRGIGPPSVLPLRPGPGLTLVVGQNGTGKSSFSEAVERVLTGATRRFAGAETDGRENWRNLAHRERCAVTVDLHAVGGATPSHVGVDWSADDDFIGGTPTGAELGGLRAIATDVFPPILPYEALGGMLSGKPSEMFDEINRLVGLEDVDALDRRLGTEITSLEAAIKEGKATRGRWESALDALDAIAGSDAPGQEAAVAELRGLDDPRSARVRLGALVDSALPAEVAAFQKLDPLTDEAVSRLVDEWESAHADETRCLAALPATVARHEELLRLALAVHDDSGDGPCPVCARGVIDGAWRERVERELAAGHEASGALGAARRRMKAARQEVSTFVDRLIDLTVTDDVPTSAHIAAEVVQIRAAVDAGMLDRVRFVALGAAVRAAHDEAMAHAEVRREEFGPVVSALDAWSVATERVSSLGGPDQLKTLRAARTWVRGELERLRDERIAAIAGQVQRTWTMLRASSSVDLGQIELTGTGTRRKLGLPCTLDGEAAKARSVLSQGELHAIALALFLPRATHPDSPFGFIVIDDPVQAMDRLKVDGLAMVLLDLARKRQVVVFTHDDRLAEAVDRMGADATVIEVVRRPGSVVEARTIGDPVERAFSDALAVARDDALDPAIRLRAAAAACRAAMEEAAVRRFRARAAVRGDLDRAEQLLGETSEFGNRISLGMYGRVQPVSDLVEGWARKVLGALSASGHEPPRSFTASELIDASRQFVARYLVEPR